MVLRADISSGGENADLRDMAAHLLAILGGPGGERGGRKAWDQLHGMLAQVASDVANPRITLDDLLHSLQDASESYFPHLDLLEADDLFRQIMLFLGKEANKERDSGMATTLLRERLLVVADQMNMVPLRDSEPVHMVDANSNFCEAIVAGIIKGSPQLSARNAPYSVISIVGAQSSGKSYLLNRLFGTMFPEMDGTRKWRQTTRGIMMSRCIGLGASFLVLDVEGFDGRERAQDTLFEKQAGLFALAVSDVMIVNMSVFNINRETGSGSTLFKTIFKERAKLEAGLTKILVVLRNYNGETPLEVLTEDTMGTLEEMWTDVNTKSEKFEDYIEVTVIALPEKLSACFPEEVTKLRRLLSDTNVDHNRSPKVLASRFSVSSEMFWNTIRKNKKLDIPSHQEALAVFFCQQAKDEALNSLYSSEDYKLLKAQESPQRFKEISDTLRGSIIITYDQETELFDPKVRDKERLNMLEKINKEFTEASWELILNVRKKTSEKFKRDYAKILKNMEETDLDLTSDDHLVDSCVTDFMIFCEGLKVFDLQNFHRRCEELQKDIQNYMKDIRARKERNLALQRSEETVQKLVKEINEKNNADAEVARQNAKNLKDELEYSRQMLAEEKKQSEIARTKQQEKTKKIIATQEELMKKVLENAEKKIAQTEQTNKILAEQAANTENMLFTQQDMLRTFTVRQDLAEEKFAAKEEQMNKTIAAQQDQAEKNTAALNEQMEEKLAEQRRLWVNLYLEEKEKTRCNIM